MSFFLFFLTRSDAIWRQRSGSPLAQVMAWCRCETIFWPPYILTPGSIYRTIFWPGGQYIVTIFWPPLTIFWPPLTIFWPPLPIVYKTSFVGYAQLLNAVYCYIYIIFMNSEMIGVEQIYQNKTRWLLVTCFYLHQIKSFITLWNHVLVVQNKSIINTQEIINMILI